MADSFTSDTYEALCRDAEGYLARGLAEQARELLLKATDLIGTRPKARSLLADACMCLGLWEEAREQLEALSTLEINNIYTHFRLGQVLEELGDFELALDNYRVVAEINPGHHGAKVALARIERKDSPEQPSEKSEQIPNGAQLFPDVPGAEDEFAGNEEGVDRLLADMGMNGRPEDGGVSELLSTLGIASGQEEKVETPRPVMDLDSIFGGAAPVSDQAPSRTDLKDIFRKAADLVQTDADQASAGAGQPMDVQDELESPIDFASIFAGTKAAPPQTPEEEPVPEPAQEPAQAGADLSSIFGDEEQAPAEEPAEEPAPEAVEEPVQEAEADLSSIFGGEEQAPAEEPAEEPAPEAVEEPVQEAEADLSSIFGGEEQAPPEEPAEEPAPEAVEEPAQESEADLSSIFGGEEQAPAEEPAEEPALEAVEEPAQESEADLSSIFGGEEQAPAEEPAEEPASEAVEEPVQEAEADLSSIFGEEESSPAEEPAPVEEPEEAPAPGAMEEPVQTGTPEADTGEPAATGAPALETDAPEAEQQESPVEEPVQPVVPDAYTLHPVESAGIPVLQLHSGSVAVRPAFLVALDSGLKLVEDDSGATLLSGNGMALLGQGYETSVRLRYHHGMAVRYDMLAVRPSGVRHMSMGLEAVPSLSRLEGISEGELLLFVSGRTRQVRLAGSMSLRAGALVAADPGVQLEEGADGWLLASGEGKIIVTS